MEKFDQKMLEVTQNSILKLLSGGEWLKIDYANKIAVEPSLLKEIYSKVDMNRVKELVTGKVEEKIADTVFNSMATEIGTDVKQILSNKELREEMRSLIRSKIRSASSKLNGY